MKVVQVCPLYYPYIGGVETHVCEISKRLANMGIDVRIYTTDPSGKLPKRQTFNGIEIFRFRSFSHRHIYFFSTELHSALKKLKTDDVIHVHAYPNFPALAAALAKHINNKPLVFTPHYGGYFFRTTGTSIIRSFAKTYYNSIIGKFIFAQADAVVALSKFEEELLHSKFKLKKEKIWHIANGVDIERFKEIKRNTYSKALIYVGRMEKYKGLAFLLKTFLKIQKFFPDSQLIFVGKGPYKKDLISMVNNSGLQKSVKFYQDLPENRLLDIYFSSRIFVLPSQFEAVPIALIEAMASGLPVIATSVGGIPEIIQSGRNGFLLNYPPDEKLLFDYLFHLLSNDEYCQKIGDEARKYVFSNFSWDDTTKHIYKLYKDTIKNFN